jgi:CHAT domain-containing protein
MSELSDQREQLEAKVSRDSATFRTGNQEVTLEQIQSAVPNDAVLIDYFHFNRTKRSDQPGPWEPEESFVVTIVFPSGEPILIDLGPVAPIAEAIDRWRQSFGATRDASAAGQRLRELIWEPLLPKLGEAETVLVSLDGVLGRLPLNALPGKEPGTYLIEDHRLAFISAPRLLPELMQADAPVRQFDRLLLVGDVDYGLNAQQQAVPWAPLPGAAAEVASLAKLYETRLPSAGQVVTLKGGQATKSRLLESLADQQVIHLATHGVFNTERIRIDAPGSGPGLDSNRGAKLVSTSNPFSGSEPDVRTIVRSGLVLFGANVERSNALDHVDDESLLMDHEILMLPLQNTELAILSACDTALGTEASGEGVLGLQRAFQIAGARTTIASLWKVSDEATEQLMARFHFHLSKPGTTRLDALRSAQLEMLRNELGKGNGTAAAANPEPRPTTVTTDSRQLQSPSYWAAFQLSGDWR